LCTQLRGYRSEQQLLRIGVSKSFPPAMKRVAAGRQRSAHRLVFK
jgi:hypothetical protein